MYMGDNLYCSVIEIETILKKLYTFYKSEYYKSSGLHKQYFCRKAGKLNFDKS